jgi:hypothetical protein
MISMFAGGSVLFRIIIFTILILLPEALLRAQTNSADAINKKNRWEKEEKKMQSVQAIYKKCRNEFVSKRENAAKQGIPNDILEELELNYLLLPTLPSPDSPRTDLKELANQALFPVFAEEFKDLRANRVAFGSKEPQDNKFYSPIHTADDEEKCRDFSSLGIYNTTGNYLVICIEPVLPLSRYYETLRHEIFHSYQWMGRKDRVEAGLSIPVSKSSRHLSKLSKFTIDKNLPDKYLKIRNEKGPKFADGICLRALMSYCMETQAIGINTWYAFLLAYNAKKLGLSEECYLTGPYGEYLSDYDYHRKNFGLISYGAEIKDVFERFSRLLDENKIQELDDEIIKHTFSSRILSYLAIYRSIGKLGPLVPELCNSRVPDMSILELNCE